MEQLRHFFRDPSAETVPGHRRLSWVVSELEEFNYEEVGSGRKHVQQQQCPLLASRRLQTLCAAGWRRWLYSVFTALADTGERLCCLPLYVAVKASRAGRQRWRNRAVVQGVGRVLCAGNPPRWYLYVHSPRLCGPRPLSASGRLN